MSAFMNMSLDASLLRSRRKADLAASPTQAIRQLIAGLTEPEIVAQPETHIAECGSK